MLSLRSIIVIGRKPVLPMKNRGCRSEHTLDNAIKLWAFNKGLLPDLTSGYLLLWITLI